MKQKHRKDSQETIGQPWGRVLAPLQGMHIFISVSCFTETPTQVEDLRFLFPVQAEREIPVSSPPTNQKRVTHPATLTPNFTFKKLAPKASGSSGLLSMNHLFFLLGPAINLSLLQTLTFQSAWPHCVSGILNLS